jgi:transcriptional regulator GlxA family with amidase domain
MQIAIPLFDKITVLDAVGPYEILSRVPGYEVVFVGAEKRAYASDNRMLRLHADATLDEVPSPEILMVPGGYGVFEEMDGPIVPWIQGAHETSTWTTSVCTGSLLLGHAGVLNGLTATTHWCWLDQLRDYGAEPTGQRVVEQGKVVTAAGVSSGIDMALTLVARLANDDLAQAIQLAVEYDPQPPFDAGAPEKAPASVVELVYAAVSERKRRSRSALATTETLDSAMASPASTGLSSPSAATGTAATL